jgi:hypothetical protein
MTGMVPVGESGFVHRRLVQAADGRGFDHPRPALAAVVGLGFPRLIATRGRHKGHRGQCGDPSQARTQHTARPDRMDRGGQPGVPSLCIPYTTPDVPEVLQPVPFAIADA